MWDDTPVLSKARTSARTPSLPPARPISWCSQKLSLSRSLYPLSFALTASVLRCRHAGNGMVDKSEFLPTVPVFGTCARVFRVCAIRGGFLTTNVSVMKHLVIPTHSRSVCSSSVTSNSFLLCRNESALEYLRQFRTSLHRSGLICAFSTSRSFRL